jgi:hypothetical protein
MTAASKTTLEAHLEVFERRLVEVFRKIVLGKIPRLIKHKKLLTGRATSKNYWYRLTIWADDCVRRLHLARAFEDIAAIYKADQEDGEEIFIVIDEFRQYLRSTKQSAARKNLLQYQQEDFMPLVTERFVAIAEGDNKKVREVSARIRYLEDQMSMTMKRAEQAKSAKA